MRAYGSPSLVPRPSLAVMRSPFVSSCAAVGRSSLLIKGAVHGPSGISFLHVGLRIQPASPSHPPLSAIPKQGPDPITFLAARGVFLASFDTTRLISTCLVSSPCPPPPPSVPSADSRSRVQSTHGTLRYSSYRRITDTGHLQHAQTTHSHFCPVLLRTFTFFFASLVPTLLP